MDEAPRAGHAHRKDRPPCYSLAVWFLVVALLFPSVAHGKEEPVRHLRVSARVGVPSLAGLDLGAAIPINDGLALAPHVAVSWLPLALGPLERPASLSLMGRIYPKRTARGLYVALGWNTLRWLEDEPLASDGQTLRGGNGVAATLGTHSAGSRGMWGFDVGLTTSSFPDAWPVLPVVGVYGGAAVLGRKP